MYAGAVVRGVNSLRHCNPNSFSQHAWLYAKRGGRGNHDGLSGMSESGNLSISVKYLSVLRDQAGRRQETLRLSAGSRLADLARWLEERHGFTYGDRQLMFVLNGRGWGQYPEGLQTPLADGDTVLLSMPVSGG